MAGTAGMNEQELGMRALQIVNTLIQRVRSTKA